MATVKLDVDLTALPAHDLASIKGWDGLEVNEQNVIKAEVTELDKALITAGTARLAVGEHLYNIREILEPKRIFTRFLKCCTNFSKASAYRYIDLYTTTAKVLPAPIVKQAMLRGIDHISPKAVEAIKPPKTTNVQRIDEYLTAIGRHRPERVTTEATPEELKRKMYNAFKSIAPFLPVNPRTRLNWIKDTLGMGLTEFGISSAQTISPVAIPESYRTPRGRPRKAA